MDIPQVINEFRDAAIAKGSEGGPRDRVLYDRMVAAYRALNAHGTEGIDAFRLLLDDSNDDVRAWVAAQLIATGDLTALPVLKAISEGAGMVASNAQMTLMEFSAGALEPPLGKPTE